jgi:glycosyltransferase involved in cell wall biosynthesis
MHRSRGNKSYALNEALSTISEGLVVFFDDDVRVHPNALSAYAAAVRQHGAGHFFGGAVEIDYEEQPPKRFIPLLPFSATGYDLKTSDMGDVYLGFNWAAFADDLRRVGGFDPRFGPGSPAGATGQEVNMQQQLLDRGLVGKDVPGAVVWHWMPAHHLTLGYVVNRHYRMGIQMGISAAEQGMNIWGTVVKEGMTAMGVMVRAILIDLGKVPFALCVIYREAGRTRGFLWEKFRTD